MLNGLLLKGWFIMTLNIDLSTKLDNIKLHLRKQHTFNPGITIFIGPNGYGKSQTLNQIHSFANNNNIPHFYYKDSLTGQQNLIQNLLDSDITLMSTMVQSSEGERIHLGLAYIEPFILDRIKLAKQKNKPLILLFDEIDSGASIDRLETVQVMLNNILSISPPNTYIFVSANNFALLKGYPIYDTYYSKYLTPITTYNEFEILIKDRVKVLDKRYA